MIIPHISKSLIKKFFKKKLERFFLLIKVSRPVGWIIAPLVFLLGLITTGGKLTPIAIAQLILLSFPYCVFLYGINDVYDYESDKINPRKKLVEGIILEPKNHSFVKKASLVSTFLLLTSSFLTLNTLNIVATLMLLFFSYYYSALPLRFKVRPPLDSFSNGLLYFLSPFLIGSSFGNVTSINLNQIFFTTLCVMGIHSFSTLLDYDVDRKIGDKTFSTIFGKRAASFFALIMFLSAVIFGKFKEAETNYYLIFCSLLFFITSIFSYKKLISLFFKLIFIGFLVVAIIHLL